MSGLKAPTSTSYAVLALLAVRPATAYELAKQVGRSLRFVWPRAEGRIYDEPKLLVAHGLARATEGATGRRPRTEYTITAKGRRALRSWLATPGAGPVLEHEALLKVGFAEHGTKDALLTNLAAVRDHAAGQLLFGDGLAEAYLEGDVPFVERVAINALMWQYLQGMNEAMLTWALEAIDEVAAWPDDLRPTDEMVAQALDRFRRGRSPSPTTASRS